jgi:hypothetical protein
MRPIAFISLATLLAGGCTKATAPISVPMFPLSATITPDNHCTVNALGKTFSSIGQVRGATLPDFSGTLDNAGYHAVGCWVAGENGTDGDLVITFSGNSFQQPFPIGSFVPTFDPPYGSSEKIASVSFLSSSFGNVKLKTTEVSTGAVTVESALSGARTIRVDVSAMKYEL